MIDIFKRTVVIKRSTNKHLLLIIIFVITQSLENNFIIIRVRGKNFKIHDVYALLYIIIYYDSR